MAEKRQMTKDERNIRKDERKKMRKKKRAKWTLGTVLVLALLLLALLGGGFLGLNPLQFYPGGEGEYNVMRSSSSESTQEATSESETMTEETSEPSMSKREIRVDGEVYYYFDEQYDLTGIEEVIKGLEKDGRPLKLIDKVAGSKAFDDVEKILKEEGFEYDIIEQYE